MAVLSYNDARFGEGRCQIIVCYPRDCAAKEDGVQACQKHLKQGHMANHVLARVSPVYAEPRRVADRMARKRQLARDGSASEGAAKKPLLQSLLRLLRQLHPAMTRSAMRAARASKRRVGKQNMSLGWCA